MTVWMLVSKQNIITDENLITHPVLLRSSLRERFPVLTKPNKKLLNTTALT